MTDGSEFPFSLVGEERQRAIERCQEVLRGWGLTMPAFDPLVLDFGLGCFHEIGEIEYWIANEEAAGYCGKFLFLFEGQRCPSHRHAAKDETFYIVRGEVEMTVEGETRRMRPGDTLKLAPGREHTFAAVGGPALVLEVSLPSVPGDNFFADERIGAGGVL